jgi:hypothetical protein
MVKKLTTLYVMIKKKGVAWVPCHHGMAHPQRLIMALNVLNKQSRIAEDGRSFDLEVGCRANHSLRKNSACCEMTPKSLRALVITVMSIRIPQKTRNFSSK